MKLKIRHPAVIFLLVCTLCGAFLAWRQSGVGDQAEAGNGEPKSTGGRGEKNSVERNVGAGLGSVQNGLVDGAGPGGAGSGGGVSGATTSTASGPAGPRTHNDDLALIIGKGDLSIEGDRKAAVDAVRKVELSRRDEAAALAKSLGVPERTVFPDGRVQEVCGVDQNNQLVAFITHNANAAISSGANLLNASPYLLDGTSVLKAGVWDGGSGLVSHQEFGGRVVSMDGAGVIDHATHVIGTIAASGVTPGAKGAGPSIPVVSYDWNSDRSEMIGAASATSTDAIGASSKLLVANQSYGYVAGWNYVGGGSPYRAWEWWGDAGGVDAVESDFGMYNTYARDTDSLAEGAPYFLMVRSAGNERNNTPTAGQAVALSPGSSQIVSYDPAIHPAGDGSYKGGYDTVSFDAGAKNIVTVGSAADAVKSGARDASRAAVSSFSSFGPVDDGRIKPDVVANGESLYSSIGTGDAAYGVSSGTSMAAPGVTGLAMLLAEDFVSRHGYSMRASTLKGLLIHTADDLGNPGPDYRYGWGLVDGKEAADIIRDNYSNPDKKRIAETTMPKSGAVQQQVFTWDGTSVIRATLCWTDPAGTSTSAGDSRTARLKHNLDLKIISPSGVVYRPFVMPFVGTWTQESAALSATNGVNNTDNVEQVLVAAPGEAGSWKTEVTSQGTLASNQTYSLILSGSATVQAAGVSLGGLSHAYDGSPKTAIVTTAPAGLAVSVTYNGGSNAPVNAGTYAVVATVTDPLYSGSASNNLTISKATQTITFPPITGRTYGDGSFQLNATSSSGLPISYSTTNSAVASVTTNGTVTIVGAGEASISAAQAGDSNWNYAESARVLSVSKASGSVQLYNLSATYDGGPKAVSVVTTPPRLPTVVDYGGTTNAPSQPGSYPVTASIVDPNYSGVGTGTLSILDAVQGVTYADWVAANFPGGGPDSADNGDPDRDGIPNRAEFYLGLNPSNTSSRLSFSIEDISGGVGTLRVSPVTSRGSFSLQKWSSLSSLPTVETFGVSSDEASIGQVSRQISLPGGQGFYRLIYSPPE